MVKTVDFPEWYDQVAPNVCDRLGFELVELTAERVVGSFPVAGNTQPIGILHGGISALLVETLGSLGAMAHALPDRVAVGVDMNVTHLRQTREGRVTGTATAVRLGGRTAIYQVDLHNDQGKLVCTGRITCQLIKRH
ncbi:MAG: aromatic compound degradation protein PaaI [Arachnia propionica]|nr:MAG: aromatic compound degradation protein PaaI [Arachnia propionica]